MRAITSSIYRRNFFLFSIAVIAVMFIISNQPTGFEFSPSGALVDSVGGKSHDTDALDLKENTVRPGNTTKACQIEIEERTIRGNSLSPLLRHGEMINISFGYYGCNPVKVDDIALYHYGNRDTPLIKMVKGVSGDTFSLRRIGLTLSWNILINDEIVVNAAGSPYTIGAEGYNLLRLYENDYRGIIPENAYLLLGNSVTGSIDSTAFGLIDKSDLLGKAEVVS